MPDMPAKMPAARRGELAAVAIEDLFKIIGFHREPAHTILRHLTHVYWNMRYVGVYPSAITRIEQAKAAGIEWDDFREQLRLRFVREDAADQGMRSITLHACLDMIPDHLLNTEGEIVWTQDRPHRTFVSSRVNKEAADPQPDDPLDPK